MEKIQKVSIIRYVYLYLVTAITIVMSIISIVGGIKIALEEYVFEVKGWEQLEDPEQYYECSEEALFYISDIEGKRKLKKPLITETEKKQTREECIVKAMARREFQHTNEVKKEVVWNLAMFIVAFPLYLIHWGIIRKEHKKK